MVQKIKNKADIQKEQIWYVHLSHPSGVFFSLNKSLPARLKATTRQEASRRDRTDFRKTEKDIG